MSFINRLHPLSHQQNLQVVEDQKNKKLVEDHQKLMKTLEISREKIEVETRYIRETSERLPATPEFVKRLNILY
ncbi:MAG: hypothetical protein EP326_14455 [Deltaproteobacteria bacterium]|jgi:hypothetical protein|nr:MAG: hypothetical protein EP326_14455 [Deltaproteobacteria bacterium]TNF25837.1 MAG: hypothetical protein EP319_15345 [Deltaproteobacteria bacterium]